MTTGAGPPAGWARVAWSVVRRVREEFPKAPTTGGPIEAPPCATVERWPPLSAVRSVGAVRLLNLRARGRPPAAQGLPAPTVVPAAWVTVRRGGR
jgi:hypothetical protein